MPTFSNVHHLALSVTDLARSIPWYQRVFGLDVVREATFAGWSTAVLASPRGGDSAPAISLYQHPGNNGEPFDEFVTGMDHVSFAVGSREELEAWRSHLDALGVDHSPLAEDPFGMVLVFRDPDNIQLELVTP